MEKTPEIIGGARVVKAKREGEFLVKFLVPELSGVVEENSEVSFAVARRYKEARQAAPKKRPGSVKKQGYSTR